MNLDDTNITRQSVFKHILFPLKHGFPFFRILLDRAVGIVTDWKLAVSDHGVESSRV